MASLIHATGHGLVAGNAFKFGNVLPTDAGVDEATVYYVLASGLTLDDFEFSTTPGGTPFVLTNAITDGVILHDDTYSVASDGIQDPPTTPATPTGLAWTSAVALDADGHQVIRIDVSIDAAADAKTRVTRVALTGPAGNALIVDFQPTQTTASILGAIGNVSYSAVATAFDVYGNASAATSAVVHTTVKDTTAPAVPTGLVAGNGILGIGVVWNSNTEADFDHYDVLVDDDVAFGSPVTFVYRGSLASIAPLTAGTYYVKVRAVDTSGNSSAYCTATSAAARLTGTSDLDPTAIINQATNLLNGPATVKVDATGLTIENGALILKDEFGTSVMVASGFSGTWQDFVSLGLYNARFLAGIAGTVTNGRSSNLPYWTVSDPDATAETLTFISGGSIKMSWGGTAKRKRIVSDKVAVNSNRFYEWGAFVTVNANGTSQVDVSIQINWYKGDLSASAHASDGPFTNAFVGGLTSNNEQSSGVAAPSDAMYAEVLFEAKESVAHDAASYCTFLMSWLTSTSKTFGSISADNLSANSVGATTGIFQDVDVTGNLEVDGVGVTTDKMIGLDATGRALVMGDGVIAKPITPIGFDVFAFPQGMDWATANSANSALTTVSAGNAGAILVPIRVVNPMLLQQLWVFCTDTATARTAEWRLFYAPLTNTAVLNEVVGAHGTWSFTPAAASWRASAAASAPVLLAPGLYWLVIRNTSATVTFGVGLAAAGLTGTPTITRVSGSSIAALGSTINTGTGFSPSNTRAVQVALHGRAFNEAAAF